MSGVGATSGAGPALPPLVPARTDDAPRLFVPSLRERLGSSLRQLREVGVDGLVDLRSADAELQL